MELPKERMGVGEIMKLIEELKQSKQKAIKDITDIFDNAIAECTKVILKKHEDKKTTEVTSFIEGCRQFLPSTLNERTKDMQVSAMINRLERLGITEFEDVSSVSLEDIIMMYRVSPMLQACFIRAVNANGLVFAANNSMHYVSSLDTAVKREAYRVRCQPASDNVLASYKNKHTLRETESYVSELKNIISSSMNDEDRKSIRKFYGFEK